MPSTGKASAISRMPHGPNTGMRLAIAAVSGVMVAVVLVLVAPTKYAPAAGWDTAAAVQLAWTWHRIWPMGADVTAVHATREDPVRPVADVVLIAASVASLVAVGFFLVQASSARGATRDLLAVVGVGTVALSWLIVHTVFTLQYAKLYYSGGDGGVDFNQTTPPRYSDFAYLSFTIGMAFQVSDTGLQTPAMRAAVLRHALLSYLFGAFILATMINLVAGLANGSG